MKWSYHMASDNRKSLATVGILCSLIAVLLLFLFLFLGVYILLIANLLPTSISSVYLFLKYKRIKSSPTDSNNKGNKTNNKFHLPLILFGLIVVPIVSTIAISIVYSFEMYLVVVSLLMPVTFMNIIFFLPLAIYDRYFKKNVKDVPLTSPLTVIVPAYNEEATIKQTINSIIQSEYLNKQIIVIDDGSTDRTCAVVSQYETQLPNGTFLLIRKPNGGKASAINLALRFAKGDIVIIVDADSVLEQNALKDMARELQQPGVIAVSGKIKVRNPSNVLASCTALELVMGAALLRPPFSMFGVVMIVPGGIGGFHKKAIINRGLYDDDTLTEDFDVTMKLLKTGGLSVGIHAISYTEVPLTLKNFYKQRIRWNRGNFQTLMKHKNAMSTRRYGMLHEFGYPLTLFTLAVPPFLDIIVAAFAVLAIVGGTGISLIVPFMLFASLQILLAAIAIEIDGKREWRLLLYSLFAVIAYKQIINQIIIRSIFDVIVMRRNYKWRNTRSRVEASAD
jgi:cellulose synthase/poly-beta-1,6-N-acetylglucosamine synthase-like glycosyltransferase